MPCGQIVLRRRCDFEDFKIVLSAGTCYIPRLLAGTRCPGGVTNFRFEKVTGMAEGTIKKVTDKGFGFIDTGNGGDMFFHMSNLDGVRFDELREGQRVTFTVGQGPKGPRAENVRPA